LQAGRFELTWALDLPELEATSGHTALSVNHAPFKEGIAQEIAILYGSISKSLDAFAFSRIRVTFLHVTRVAG
jgi:hypothetical protein